MRARLLRSIVAVTILAVVLFGVPLAVAAARLYRSREVSRLERQATLAAGALPTSGLRGTDPIELPRHPGPVRLALYDDRGRRAAGTGPTQGDELVTQALRGKVVDEHEGAWLAVAVPVHDEELVVGAARAAVPWDSVDDATHRSWFVMAGLAAGAVAIAGAVAVWQSSRLSAPVRAVAARAADLGRGDFASRVDASGVAELDEVTDALNRAAARLDEMVARERRFAADVSHQLNTPLTSLRLALESALVTPGADLPASIHQAIDEVGRLERTVDTLLALQRDDRLADGTCDPAAVSTAVAGRFRSALASAGRPLRLELEPDLPAVRCSGEILGEVLSVLMDNAVMHGDGEVTLAGRRAGSGVVLDIEDAGAGVVGDRDVVFQRRAAQATGHGIGLALARSLAEAHGARLELTRAGPQPVFSVALPGVARAAADL